MDITYLPMAVASCISPWCWIGPPGASWRGGCPTRLSADFCVEALDEAIARYGMPEIMNTDQGSQFTGSEFIDVLERHQMQSAWMARAAGATTSGL